MPFFLAPIAPLANLTVPTGTGVGTTARSGLTDAKRLLTFQ